MGLDGRFSVFQRGAGSARGGPGAGSEAIEAREGGQIGAQREREPQRQTAIAARGAGAAGEPGRGEKAAAGADIGGDGAKAGRAAAMLPAIAIAARRAAALAARHPAPRPAVDRGRAASVPRAGARAAAGRGGEDGRL